MCWKMSNVQSRPEVIATTTAITTKRATKVKQNIKDSRAGALTLNAFHFSRQFLHFSHLRYSFEFLLADGYSVNKLVLFRKFFSKYLYNNNNTVCKLLFNLFTCFI